MAPETSATNKAMAVWRQFLNQGHRFLKFRLPNKA